jgi:diadenosine tetraphosphate (Ap4A) HIT family hydrolase
MTSKEIQTMCKCVFCEIIEGKREAEILYSNEHVLAFKGLTSIADVHEMASKKYITCIIM